MYSVCLCLYKMALYMRSLVTTDNRCIEWEVTWALKTLVMALVNYSKHVSAHDKVARGAQLFLSLTWNEDCKLWKFKVQGRITGASSVDTMFCSDFNVSSCSIHATGTQTTDGEPSHVSLQKKSDEWTLLKRSLFIPPLDACDFVSDAIIVFKMKVCAMQIPDTTYERIPTGMCITSTEGALSHVIELCKNMYALQATGAMADLTLSAQDGSECRIHRVILCAASDVFARMLTTDMQERATSKVMLDLPDRTALDLFVKLVYVPSTTHIAQSTMVSHLHCIKVFHEYTMHMQLALCEQQVAKTLNQANCLQVYSAVCQLDIPLRQVAMDMCKIYISILVDSDDISRLLCDMTGR